MKTHSHVSLHLPTPQHCSHKVGLVRPAEGTKCPPSHMVISVTYCNSGLVHGGAGHTGGNEPNDHL